MIRITMATWLPLSSDRLARTYTSPCSSPLRSKEFCILSLRSVNCNPWPLSIEFWGFWVTTSTSNCKMVHLAAPQCWLMKTCLFISSRNTTVSPEWWNLLAIWKISQLTCNDTPTSWVCVASTWCQIKSKYSSSPRSLTHLTTYTSRPLSY